MRISNTILVLILSSFAFLVSTVVAQDKLSSSQPVATEPAQTDIDPIYAGTTKPTKGLPGMPHGLNEADFQVTKEREPASVKPLPKVKAPAQHWSASTSDGFEFKVRVKNQVSAVWVMKRDEHFDVVFANNAGSRVNLSIPAEQFYALKNAATDLRAPASDVSKCKDQFMQLEMVETKSRKIVQTCLATKGKEADQLRQFGSVLTAMVR